MQKRLPGATAAAAAGAEEDEEDGGGGTTAGGGTEGGGTLEKYSGVKVRISFTRGGETMSLKQLSGGQRTLVALALIFAIQVGRRGGGRTLVALDLICMFGVQVRGEGGRARPVVPVSHSLAICP